MQSDVNFPLVPCKPATLIIQPKFNQCKRFVLHPHFLFIYLTISILGSSTIFGFSLKYTLRFVPSTPRDSDLSHSRTNDYHKVTELKELLNDKIVVKETKQLTNKIKEYLSEYQSVIDAFKKIDFEKMMSGASKDQIILRKMLAFNAQFDKIYRVGQIAINNMKQIENLHAPINRFERSVNMFFKEGNKEIKVGGSGDLYIINRNLGAETRQNIFDLSSGEKQIIILMAYLSFKASSKIFIVDEPEVSLHVSWQEKFVDALMEASPNNQFVLATHAPSIIAKSVRRTWCEDLSK